VPVEFLGIAATNDGSEITARSGPILDKEYTLRPARAHEENGWDRVLFAYGSSSPTTAGGDRHTIHRG
jgi:alkanesulfonate monooxygenase